MSADDVGTPDTWPDIVADVERRGLNPNDTTHWVTAVSTSYRIHRVFHPALSHNNQSTGLVIWQLESWIEASVQKVKVKVNVDLYSASS